MTAIERLRLWASREHAEAHFYRVADGRWTIQAKREGQATFTFNLEATGATVEDAAAQLVAMLEEIGEKVPTSR